MFQYMVDAFLTLTHSLPVNKNRNKIQNLFVNLYGNDEKKNSKICSSKFRIMFQRVVNYHKSLVDYINLKKKKKHINDSHVVSIFIRP